MSVYPSGRDRIRALRAWYNEDSHARAVAFAFELNAAAIDEWPGHKSAQYLEEAAEILLELVDREGVSMRAVRAVSGVLGNRCQLRCAHGIDPARDLEAALAAGQAGVAFVREAADAYLEHPAPDPPARAELDGLLAKSLAFHARALADAGQLEDAHAAIAEAVLLLAKLERDSAEPASQPEPGIGAKKDLADFVADSRRYVNGETVEIDYELWLGDATPTPTPAHT